MKSWQWLLASTACLVLLTGGGGPDDIDMPTRLGLAAMGLAVPGVMAHADDSLVDGWGVTFKPARLAWRADNGAGKSALDDGKGGPPSLVVPISLGAARNARPKGIVSSGTTDLVISAAGRSGPGQQDADGDEDERAGVGVVDAFGSTGGLRRFQQPAAGGQLR